ncbi:Transcriptional regulator, XRE family [Candidatus Promineifilum breve]|uniref:Transcriptional regulator, XRE family n=1 Tax=Candidatus Promineifilum breve TaxID=1806508 RepID=A0A160T6U4_9CHLR|nr:helix-turn-helix transcriptional regulator [Candidatus Promineifilum breve]CUS05008.2 Transcriptional regulator, XRE family [Candidatus Promineifilum breve]
MSIQLILKEGQPEYAVLPYETYLRLVEDAEMLADVRDYDAAIQAIAEGEELIPAEVVYALLDGANPIRVWREYRGLSQGELAAKVGISPSYLSQLESGKRDGTMEVLSAVAAALDVTLDDLAG